MDHPGFNRTFTDADEETLIHLGPIASHPQHRYHNCVWMTNQQPCGAFVLLQDLPEHMRIHHGITCSDKTPVTCCWVNCFIKMKKESLVRHIQEIHLELRYPCPNCPEQFTRSHTLHRHVSKKHAGS